MTENNSKSLYFFHGAMGSAKTALLLMKYYHYKNDNGNDVLLFKPSIDNRYGDKYVRSRTGLKAKANVINNETNILEYVKSLKKKPKIIMVDEVQFLLSNQIDQLKKIADEGIIVETYGLKNNFKNQLFGEETGTIKRLLELAKAVEIRSYCVCGNNATDVARYDPNTWKIVREGPEILIGGNNEYVSLCYKCWSQELIPRQSRIKLLESRIKSEEKKKAEKDDAKIKKYKQIIFLEKTKILQDKLEASYQRRSEIDNEIKKLTRNIGRRQKISEIKN